MSDKYLCMEAKSMFCLTMFFDVDFFQCQKLHFFQLVRAFTERYETKKLENVMLYLYRKKQTNEGKAQKRRSKFSLLPLTFFVFCIIEHNPHQPSIFSLNDNSTNTIPYTHTHTTHRHTDKASRVLSLIDTQTQPSKLRVIRQNSVAHVKNTAKQTVSERKSES